jgi:hypothetical protein
MKQQITNFSRFYRAFSRMERTTEEMKCELVLQFTGGRTDSLKEIESEEYESLCRSLELSVGLNDGSVTYDELKRRRSEVLHLMQKIGVDTADWSRVDNFCLHPKIAGSPFRLLSAKDLAALSVKLRAIQRNGGLKSPQKETPAPAPAPAIARKAMVVVPLFGSSGQMPN